MPVGRLTSTLPSLAVSPAGMATFTSTWRANASASSLNACSRAAGSALMTWPLPASAMLWSGPSCFAVWFRATTSTRSSPSPMAAVTSSRSVLLVSAPSESTSSVRWPSVPAIEAAASTPS